MKTRALALFCLAAASALLPSVSPAQIYNSCDQWASVTTNGYTIYNNIWGSGAGSQCLTVNSSSNWYIDANHPNTSGIKSYPNGERKLNLNVDSMGAVTSAFAVTRPSDGSYSSTYDIWYDNYAYEIMLWMNRTGAVGPIASAWDANGNPIAEVTNVTVGGHTWNVYRGSNGSNAVFSFVRTTNTNSGTVDITAISQWLRSRGWFGNANLHSVQFGFEITASNGNERYAVTNYSVTAGTSSTNLTVSPTSLNFGTAASSQNVSVTSNTTWTVVDNQSWINLSTATGSNNGNVSVSVVQNTNSASRSGTVSVAGGGITRTIAVTQAGTGSTGGSVANGTYSLQNRANGKMLDNLGVSNNGANVGQWSDGSSNNQRWVVSTVGSYRKLQCVTGGRYLDGMGRTSDGSLVGQWDNSSSNNQQWTFTATDSGYYKIINRATGKCLDTGGNSADGAAMQQWSNSSNVNQQWRFVTP